MRLVNGIDLAIQLATCKAHLVGNTEWINGYRDGLSVAFDLLGKAPSVDAEPVKHGQWEKYTEMRGVLRCSVCKKVYIYDEWLADGKWKFCPNCGAKMDGERKET